MAFRSFYKELDSDLTWQNIDTDIAREWVVSMMEKGHKPSSIQRRLSALRSCYRFLFKRGLVDRDPVHNLTAPKRERPLPAFIREEEMDRLLDTDGMFADTFEGRRDKLIISMFYETGLRLSELVGLNLKDINLTAQSVKVLGKGNKERIVPFGDGLLHLINIYIGERAGIQVRETDREALFVSAKGKRLTGSSVRTMVRRQLGLVTEQRKRSPHVLRHTFATTMLNHEANLESVKELLGHEKLQTTEIYTHTTFEELKKVYSEAHPRA
jgi:integrase/recombinase XerC